MVGNCSKIKMPTRDKIYWDKRYKTENSGIGSYGQWANFKLQKIKEVNEVDSILDVGFGDLNMGLQIASFFPEASYLGIDISETALQKAKAKNLNKRFRFKLIETPIFYYPSDLVICLDVLWHITQDEDYEKTLKSLKQSYIKHLFLTTFGDEALNKHTGNHMKIRKFVPTYFSEDYKRTLVPLGDKNTYLYYFERIKR